MNERKSLQKSGHAEKGIGNKNNMKTEEIYKG
jgi:hypothetical protein